MHTIRKKPANKYTFLIKIFRKNSKFLILGCILGCVLAFLFSNIKNATHFNDGYSKMVVRTHKDETLGVKVNPREYRNAASDVDNTKPTADTDSLPYPTKDMATDSTAPVTPPTNSPNDTSIDTQGDINSSDSISNSFEPNEPTDADGSIVDVDKYDFSPLYFWGFHEFRDSIVSQDIDKLQTLMENFQSGEECNAKLTKILDSLEKDDEKVAVTLKKIDDFKTEETSNSDLVNSKDYYENAENLLYVFKSNNNFETLEQAAIYAESAAEKEQIESLADYDDYITYIETSVIGFIHVSNSDWEEYASGSSEDIKYRIGKLVYKPAANLQHISNQEKYYSLTGAYIILQDAYSHSTSESKYSVEIAFYFLGICTDIVKFMEPCDRRDNICREGIGAYAEFDRRGCEHPDNSTYSKYSQDAKDKLNYLEDMISSTALTDTQITQEEVNQQ